MPNYILLMVENAERSLDFYRSLGFQEEMVLRFEGRIYFGEMSYQGRGSGHLLMVLEKTWWNFADDMAVPAKGAGVLIYVPVENLDAVYRALPTSAPIMYPLTDLYYGREFVVRDPDGYKIAFFQGHEQGERLMEGMEKWSRNGRAEGCAWLKK